MALIYSLITPQLLLIVTVFCNRFYLTGNINFKMEQIHNSLFFIKQEALVYGSLDSFKNFGLWQFIYHIKISIETLPVRWNYG